MHAVGKEDDEALGGRIDPERRSGEARVADGARREKVTAILRVSGRDVPSQAPNVSVAVEARTRHRFDAGRREDAPVPQRSGPASQPKAGPKAVRPANNHKGH